MRKSTKKELEKLLPHTKQKDIYKLVIVCEKCKSYDVDIEESFRGCENPVNAITISCLSCGWEKVLYDEHNCIPIPEDMMKRITQIACFDLQITDAEFVYSLIYDYFSVYDEHEEIR